MPSYHDGTPHLLVDKMTMNVIKPGKRPYIVFGTMVFLLLLLEIYAVLFRGKSIEFGVEASMAIIAIFLPWFIWFHSQKIAFSDEVISYTSWYFLRRTIRIQNIEKWSVWLIKMEIHPIDKTQDDMISIALRPYADSDLKRLFAALPKDKEEGKGIRLEPI